MMQDLREGIGSHSIDDSLHQRPAVQPLEKRCLSGRIGKKRNEKGGDLRDGRIIAGTASSQASQGV